MASFSRFVPVVPKMFFRWCRFLWYINFLKLIYNSFEHIELSTRTGKSYILSDGINFVQPKDIGYHSDFRMIKRSALQWQIIGKLIRFGRRKDKGSTFSVKICWIEIHSRRAWEIFKSLSFKQLVLSNGKKVLISHL